MMAYFFRFERSYTGVAWVCLLAGLVLPGLAATAADGDFVWARAMGGEGFDAGRGIAVDSEGNVYTTGSFVGTADFDPGAGTFNLTSAGNVGIFVQKLDSEGNFIWARSMGGTGDDQGLGIAVDAAGNVYTTGSFVGTVDFDPGSGTFILTSAGGADIFVQKLDRAGNLVWARAMGGADLDRGLGIAVDGAGNVHTTGLFAGMADFDPGAGSFNLTAAGFVDIFVQKLDRAGNLVWARAMGGTGLDAGRGIAVDGAGNVHTTGHFMDIADFDRVAGTFNLVSAGFADIFVHKISGPDTEEEEGPLGGCGSSSPGVVGGGRLGDWVVLGVAVLVLLGWRGRGGVPGRG